MKTFNLLLAKINSPGADLPRLEIVITRHYNNGTITAKELMRLDVRIMEKSALK